MSRRPGPVVVGILSALREIGPMSGSNLNRELGGGLGSIRSVLARLAKPQVTLPKRIHISGWTSEAEGERLYPRPVYSLGDKENKARPAPGKSKAGHPQSSMGVVSSVWDLANP